MCIASWIAIELATCTIAIILNVHDNYYYYSHWDKN